MYNTSMESNLTYLCGESWIATESYDCDEVDGFVGCVIGMLTIWPSSLIIRKRTVGSKPRVSLRGNNVGSWSGAEKRRTDCKGFAFSSSDTGEIYCSNTYEG